MLIFQDLSCQRQLAGVHSAPNRYKSGSGLCERCGEVGWGGPIVVGSLLLLTPLITLWRKCKLCTKCGRKGQSRVAPRAEDAGEGQMAASAGTLLAVQKARGKFKAAAAPKPPPELTAQQLLQAREAEISMEALGVVWLYATATQIPTRASIFDTCAVLPL